MALNCSAEGPGPMAARGWDKETPPPFCDVQHGAVAGALDPSENVPGPRSGGVHNFSRGVGVNWEAGLPESWGEGGEPLTELYSGPRPFNLWRLFPPPPNHVFFGSYSGIFSHVTNPDWTFWSLLRGFCTHLYFRLILTFYTLTTFF